MQWQGQIASPSYARLAMTSGGLLLLLRGNAVLLCPDAAESPANAQARGETLRGKKNARTYEL